MNKKTTTPVIDSKHLKILSIKKDLLKDSIVFVYLNEQKYGNLDKAMLRKLVASIDAVEPNGIYFPVVKNINVQLYDKAEFKNKDILVTINADQTVDTKEIEEKFKQALPHVKSIEFIHEVVSVDKK